MSAIGSELRAIAQQSTSRETLAAIANEVEQLEAESQRLREVIKQFAYSQRWAHRTWKDQPGIKPLFDIADTLTGGDTP